LRIKLISPLDALIGKVGLPLSPHRSVVALYLGEQLQRWYLSVNNDLCQLWAKYSRSRVKLGIKNGKIF